MHPLLGLSLAGVGIVNTFLLAVMVFAYQDAEHPSSMPSLWPWLLWSWIGVSGGGLVTVFLVGLA